MTTDAGPSSSVFQDLEVRSDSCEYSVNHRWNSNDTHFAGYPTASNTSPLQLMPAPGGPRQRDLVAEHAQFAPSNDVQLCFARVNLLET